MLFCHMPDQITQVSFIVTNVSFKPFTFPPSHSLWAETNQNLQQFDAHQMDVFSAFICKPPPIPSEFHSRQLRAIQPPVHSIWSQRPCIRPALTGGGMSRRHGMKGNSRYPMGGAGEGSPCLTAQAAIEDSSSPCVGRSGVRGSRKSIGLRWSLQGRPNITCHCFFSLWK